MLSSNLSLEAKNTDAIIRTVIWLQKYRWMKYNIAQYQIEIVTNKRRVKHRGGDAGCSFIPPISGMKFNTIDAKGM